MLDHGTNRLALVHQSERFVDARERQLVGDQTVDVDLTIHVPVDDLRHIRATARATEGRAFPYPSCDELKRSRGDFLTCARHADDHADAPAAMTTLERLSHQLHVAHAFEAVVRAAL